MGIRCFQIENYRLSGTEAIHTPFASDLVAGEPGMARLATEQAVHPF